MKGFSNIGTGRNVLGLGEPLSYNAANNELIIEKNHCFLLELRNTKFSSEN